jgi:holo-[acyl-carrier protein] synthase
MILGIGNDIIDIRRIEKTVARYGQRFIDRLYTDVEKRKSERRAERIPSYAKRFAAKEACSKALGTGLSHGVYWRDMGVVNLPSGKPTLHLTNGAALQLARMVPEGRQAVVHLTMTDEYPYAQAIVIIEAV